jgi:hypothetical protein
LDELEDNQVLQRHVGQVEPTCGHDPFRELARRQRAIDLELPEAQLANLALSKEAVVKGSYMLGLSKELSCDRNGRHPLAPNTVSAARSRSRQHATKVLH